MSENKKYLGDGVYATFDGHQIWLETERGFHTDRIALEPAVFISLVGYAQRDLGWRFSIGERQAPTSGNAYGGK